jgi:hypothetical protein
MVDLQTQIAESTQELKSAWTGLQSVPPSVLPSRCYEQWTKRAMLHRVLDGTSSIFPARHAAWAAVQAVMTSATHTPNPASNMVQHGGIEMDFSIARYLSLTSYVAVTWAVYDRLANVCGRLAGVAELAEHPKQNPKACEDFLGKKDILGFGSHVHIREAYAWPLKITYKVRNWLVHEGYEEGGTQLFCGDRIPDGFRLHEDAAKYLQRCCDYAVEAGKIERCCISAADECWDTRDLLQILTAYHQEVDELFAVLVKWSVNAFVSQIQVFAARDNT